MVKLLELIFIKIVQIKALNKTLLIINKGWRMIYFFLTLHNV